MTKRIPLPPFVEIDGERWENRAHRGAWRKGVEARQRGESRTDCPYNDTKQVRRNQWGGTYAWGLRRAWRAGWDETDRRLKVGWTMKGRDARIVLRALENAIDWQESLIDAYAGGDGEVPRGLRGDASRCRREIAQYRRVTLAISNSTTAGEASIEAGA